MLSDWQSECSGFPLRFFTNPGDPYGVHLVTGWTSVATHEAWIRGERNQELLRVFGPYVDMEKIRMAHVDVDFEAIPIESDGGWMVIERYDSGQLQVRGKSTPVERERLDGSRWSLIGRDLARDDGDVFRFVGVASGEVEVGEGVAPVEWWALKRVKQ